MVLKASSEPAKAGRVLQQEDVCKIGWKMRSNKTGEWVVQLFLLCLFEVNSGLLSVDYI